MTETILDQIISIRDSGLTNMFDADTVQRLAFEVGYYELVAYIEEDKERYFNFILYGKEK